MAMASETKKKLVIAGHATCGKTLLMVAYLKDQFFENNGALLYEYLFDDGTSASVEVDGKQVELTIWDSFGQEDHSRIRIAHTYPGTDVYLLCCSVNFYHLFDEIPLWVEEFRRVCPEVPIILVGTQIDLRDDVETVEKEFVKFEDGRAMAKRIKAVTYVECSAKTRQGVKEVFEAAARAIVKKESGGGKMKKLMTAAKKLIGKT